MLNLPLKQAETALSKGQLDEAFTLLRQRSARSTRQAQELAAQLVTALVTRGNGHLSDQRLTAAASDAAKALELGGQQPEAVALFEAVQQARTSRDKRQRHDDELLRQAKREIQRGGASVGKQILDRANLDDTDVKHWAQQIDVRRDLCEAALQRASDAIDQGHNEQALDILIELVRSQPDQPGVTQELTRVVTKVSSTLEHEVRSGRLDRVTKWQRRLEAIATTSVEARELVDLIERCHRAAVLIEQFSFSEADRQLGLLAQTITGVTWIDETRATLQDLMCGVNRLNSGPLGLVPLLRESPAGITASQKKLTGITEPTLESSRHLLQIDGVGSVLLLRSDVIQIGSASRSNGMDIPLMTDGIDAPVQIRRQAGDYLLTSPATLEINGRQATNRLLVDGDVITIGRRGRIRFHQPIAASATAILELTSAPMQRAEIRQVALFADSLIIGKGPHSHILVRDTLDRHVLYSRGQSLAMRCLTADADSARNHPSVPVPIGQPVTVGELRLRITPYQTPVPANRLSSMRGHQYS